jgi:fucose 4-O-acetylase-like acetyltransferase
VWFHTEAPGYLAAYAALPFFLVLLALPSRARIKERARRLLVPFAIWSAICALFLVLISAKNGQDLFGWWRPQMIVMGPSIHLWFLPFAFLVALSIWVYLGHILVIHRFQSDGLEGYSLALASLAGALVLAVAIELVLRRLRPAPSPAKARPTP